LDSKFLINSVSKEKKQIEQEPQKETKNKAFFFTIK